VLTDVRASISASLMKLHVKADSVAPAVPDKVVHIEWAGRVRSVIQRSRAS
jgi:hypothetical protein